MAAEKTKQGSGSFVVEHGRFSVGGIEHAQGDIVKAAYSEVGAAVVAGTLREISAKEEQKLERRRAFEAKLAAEEEGEEEEAAPEEDEEEDEKPKAKAKPADSKPKDEEKLKGQIIP